MQLRATLFICWLTTAWLASWVAVATLRLNADQAWSSHDRITLLLILAILYGLLLSLYGVTLGTAAGIVRRRWPSDAVRQHADRLQTAAAWTPFIYISLMLPDIVPTPRQMGERLTETLPLAARLAVSALVALLVIYGIAAWTTRRSRAEPPTGGGSPTVPPGRRFGKAPWLLALLPLVPCFGLWNWQPQLQEPEYLLSPLPAVDSSLPPPPPLLLLVIDGADLDDMILPMVEDGELPTFADLMRRGTWGKLASRKPTLSPVLWTSLATGKTGANHGVADFVYYHLPGVQAVIQRFPPGSGLNHRLFPHLEELGLGFERPPYSRLQRRARPLWDIIGERYPVGVYRWLVTWPAEPVHGFLVAGGVYAGPGDWNPKAKSWLKRMRQRSDSPLTSLALFPADAMQGLAPYVMQPPDDAALQPYAPDVPVQRRHKHFRLVARSLVDPTGWELPRLMDKYTPRFTAASFYAVDSFQHRFGKAYREGGPWAGAIAERYRESDRQLGRLLATLPESHHLLVISDHGYDFDLDHHWQAPAGAFFGVGPAFAPGRRVDALGLLDIAPLTLHLLDFPLPDDMPGSHREAYLQVLRPSWPKPEQRLVTYERPPADDALQTLPASLSDAMKEELRSLGYIQ